MHFEIHDLFEPEAILRALQQQHRNTSLEDLPIFIGMAVRIVIEWQRSIRPCNPFR